MVIARWRSPSGFPDAPPRALHYGAPKPMCDASHMRPSVVLLGTGGPRPDIARGATSLLIEVGDDAILIDAGRGVVRQLAALDVPLSRINPVLITHHHYDHIGELHDSSCHRG